MPTLLDADSLDAKWLDAATVNDLLRAGNRWIHGPVVTVEALRVGIDFGFSGRVYRLELTVESGAQPSIIAKFETAKRTGRAVAFRYDNELQLGEQIPNSYGYRIDGSDDRGVLLLEDVRPATQGDDSLGCTEAQADTIVRLIAKLHATTWMPSSTRPTSSPGNWSQREWEPGRWDDRLSRATQRFPDGFSSSATARLEGFSAETVDAYDQLERGPRAWVHRDPHPDNALWRPDGRLVMLDWSNAMIAPPAIDVAVMLSSLSFRSHAPLSTDALLSRYRAALSDNGLDLGAEEIRRDAQAAVRLLIRGSVGWAGATITDTTPSRMLELQAQIPERTTSALIWLDESP